ncbi:hypothetical protein V5O48_014948 [Marasmius crinis-equi]|uniref:Uncharacterized protein n=1 Tax=Marasmius crinis-equi TaxID=585013 RepID=A0ABR3EVW6_9AGAR
MPGYPDCPYIPHFRSDCNGGKDCADDAGCALDPFQPLLNVDDGSLIFADIEQQATFALGAKFCPEVVMRVQCSQQKLHEIRYLANWEEGGEDLIMKRTDWDTVRCDCAETLYIWDWKAANCIISGVQAYMKYRQPAVEEAERMVADGTTSSDRGYSPDNDSSNVSSSESSSDISNNFSSETASETSSDLSTKSSSNSSDDSSYKPSSESSGSSESSDEEPPRKKRKIAARNVPRVLDPGVQEYIEELDNGQFREYVDLLNTE